MDYQEAPLVGLAAIGLVLVHLVAVGLGIAGLFQKETKKLSPSWARFFRPAQS